MSHNGHGSGFCRWAGTARHTLAANARPGPAAWPPIPGAFTNLRSYVRLGQTISSSGGTVSWAGAGNTLDWGAFSTVQKDAVPMSTR